MQHFAEQLAAEVGRYQVAALAGLVLIGAVGDVTDDVLVVQLPAGGDLGHITIGQDEFFGRVLETVNLHEVGVAALVLDAVTLGIGVLLDQVHHVPFFTDGLSFFKYHLSVSGFMSGS